MDIVKAALRAFARERPEIPEMLVRELVLGALDSATRLELASLDQDASRSR